MDVQTRRVWEGRYGDYWEEKFRRGVGIRYPSSLLGARPMETMWIIVTIRAVEAPRPLWRIVSGQRLGEIEVEVEVVHESE